MRWKVVLSIVCFVNLFFVQKVSSQNCYDEPNQNSQNQCMENLYKQTQKRLDALVIQLKKDPFASSQNFESYLKTWIEFRKNHCEQQMQSWGTSSSMGAFVYSSCLQRLTSAKVKEFEAIIEL